MNFIYLFKTINKYVRLIIIKFFFFRYKVHVVSKDTEGGLPLSDDRKFNPFTERKIENPTT